MSTKLTTPIVLLLYLPLLAGTILLSANPDNFRWGFVAGNMLSYLAIALLFCVHAWQALSFCKQIPRPSIIFKINTLIPAVVFTLYFFYVLRTQFSGPVHSFPPNAPVPMRIARNGINGLVIFAFMIHGLVSFIFITNQYVSAKIKALKDPDQQSVLRENYLVPMQKVVRIGGWIFGGFLLLTMVLDVIVLVTGG